MEECMDLIRQQLQTDDESIESYLESEFLNINGNFFLFFCFKIWNATL